MYRFRQIGLTSYGETIREISDAAGAGGGGAIDVFGSWGDWPGDWASDSVAHNADFADVNAREPWGGETSVGEETVNVNALMRYAQMGPPTEERAIYLHL